VYTAKKGDSHDVIGARSLFIPGFSSIPAEKITFPPVVRERTFGGHRIILAVIHPTSLCVPYEWRLSHQGVLENINIAIRQLLISYVCSAICKAINCIAGKDASNASGLMLHEEKLYVLIHLSCALYIYLAIGWSCNKIGIAILLAVLY